MSKTIIIKSAGFCIIRKDLQKENLRVPIGTASYYSGSYPLSYRWLKDDEGFQVFFQGSWQDAESIDFDFLDTEKQIVMAHFKSHNYSSAIEEIKEEWTAMDLKEFLRHCGYKTNYCKGILVDMVHDLIRIERFKIQLTTTNPFLVK